jgi:hypothetical protein
MAADPDWNPDTGGRSLAEILREAGIEAPKSVRRRERWETDTGIRQRGSGGAPPEGRPSIGRRRSDSGLTDTGRTDSALSDSGRIRERRRPVPEPSTAAIPGLRPERSPGVPAASGPVAAAPVRERRATEDRPGRRAADDRPARRPDRRRDEERPARRPVEERPPAERPPAERAPIERTPAERAPAQRKTAERKPAERKPAERKPAERKRKTSVDEDFSTGPIPVVRPEDLEEDASPRESALAWARFVGELVIALAAGVGIYFLFNVLWENLPYVAVLLAPFAVTALVGGVTFWRQRMGHEPVGARLMVVLVFAGTLLTIVPAAQLLNPS